MNLLLVLRLQVNGDDFDTEFRKRLRFRLRVVSSQRAEPVLLVGLPQVVEDGSALVASGTTDDDEGSRGGFSDRHVVEIAVVGL